MAAKHLGDLTGSPWHVEKFTRAEGDDRRHRSRCKYYNDKGCDYYGRCKGSAHCDIYKEKVEAKETEHKKVVAACPVFTGLMDIPIKTLQIQKNFSVPNKEKIESLTQFFLGHGKFDKPIIVSCSNGNYFLEENYARYFAAKSMGLLSITALCATKEEIESIAKIQKIGRLVWNTKDKDVGEITYFDAKTIKVKMDSGKNYNFDLYHCIHLGTIKPL